MTLSNMSPSHPFARRRGYERCKVTKSFREYNDLAQIYTLFNRIVWLIQEKAVSLRRQTMILTIRVEFRGCKTLKETPLQE